MKDFAKVVGVTLLLVLITGMLVFIENKSNNTADTVSEVEATETAAETTTAKETTSQKSSSGSYKHYSSSSSNVAGKSANDNRTKPLSQYEADRLRGTGYDGKRPNSFAEGISIKALQRECCCCGYYTENGENSECNYCKYYHNEVVGDEIKNHTKHPDYKYYRSSSSSSKKTSSSSYNAKNYSDVDDFYDDYYDDFDSFDEAEDYYDSNY